MVTSHKFSDRIFSEFFPPPKFLEMPAAGLSISDSAISAVELERDRDSFAVRRFGRRVLPLGVISGGYINDKDKVLSELKSLKSDLQIDFVNASFSEEKAYLFKTQIPRVARKEIRGALDLTLEEHVPLKIAEAIFDYIVINSEEHRKKDHLEISVTVLPEKVVQTYSELLRSAGFSPLSFEVEAQAVARSLVGFGDSGAYLIINFCETRTGIFIICDKVVQFTSTVAIGGQHLTEAIAKYLSVGIAEADAIKKERAALTESKNARLFLQLMNTLSVLKDEVNKLLLYWHTHKELGGENGKKIKKIFLCGRDAGLSGFDEYFSLALSLPVEIGNVWRNVCSFEEYIPPISFGESLDYAAAVGLALHKSH